MGCISQNGCLGPRRREKEVFAELLQAIFLEAQSLEDEEVSQLTIRQRVTKKGVLRKLLDHLLSHKNKIAECLNYTLRLVTLTPFLTRKLAGLLVVDNITAHIYRVSRVDVIEDGRTLVRAKTGSSENRLLEQTEVKVGADLRYDLAYFRLVLHLLESEPRALQPVLISIMGFCSGRRERLGCRTEVWRTLEVLLQHLQKGLEMDKAAKCYLQLLQLLKQGAKEEEAHEGDLLVFLRIWLNEQQREPESASVEGLQSTIFRIIKLFVGRCLSAWDAKVLFRSLFQLYEDQRVSVARLQKLQQMVLNIVRDSDLHAHILRGLFLYLLQFLSAFPPDRPATRGSFSEQFQMQRYPHIASQRVRLRLFETLRRWGERNYIDLNQSVTFSSSALVGAYTNNLRGQRQYVQGVVREFLALSKALNQSSSLILVGNLLQQVRNERTEQATRRLLVGLARQVLEAGKLLDVPGQDLSGLLVPLEPYFSKDTRIELIQLVSFVVDHLTHEQLTADPDQNPTCSSLCEFLHSLHEGGKALMLGKMRPREEEQILYRYQYANSVLSFVRCLVGKYAYLHVLCFIGAIGDRLGLESDASSPLALYFDLYLIYEAMHLINPKHKVPDRIIGINFKIAPSSKSSSETKQEIISFMMQVSGQKGELFPQLRSKISKDISSLRQFTMISEADFRQMQITFQFYFKSSHKQQSLLFPSKGSPQLNSSMDVSRNQFKRESLNGSFYQTNSQRSKNDDDSSFKDIVERINDE